MMLATVLASAACGNVIARKYEYEEEIFLALDGSATVYVNASVPALVALRGASLPLDPRARLDRTAVRDWFESPVADVSSVTLSRREGRRYVHLRLRVPDIRKLAEAAPFAWSTYRYQQRDNEFEYAQTLGAAAGRSPGDPGWDGTELVAVRLHLPSKVTFHNSPSKTIERGNIIVWEQPLSDRRTGAPIEIVARMETQSILVRTLALFGAMAVLVVFTFIGFIWFVKSRKPAGDGGTPA
jgi:hypothetical protein